MNEVPSLNPIKRDRKVSSHEDVLVNILADAGRQAQAQSCVRVLPEVNGKPARLLQEARQCSRLRAQLASVLRSPELEETSRRRSAGHVDIRAMGRLAAGDFVQPFARRTQREGWETEIVVLLDGSSSMLTGKRLWRTAVLALAIVQAAEQVGIRSEVVQFNDGVDGVNALRVVKTAAERLSSPAVMERFARVSEYAYGGTPLSTALATVAAQLIVRAPGKRKLVFAITDGECNCGEATVRAVANDAERRGVEVVGLSIETPVMGAFEHEVRVDAGDDMMTVGLGLLARVLAARGQRVQS